MKQKIRWLEVKANADANKTSSRISSSCQASRIRLARFSNIFPLSLDDGNGQIVHVSIEMNVAWRPAVAVLVIFTPPPPALHSIPFRIPPSESPTPVHGTTAYD
uniref:HDC09488 n=1 Tax=Drosophila melanogaster TaxID=7227 RepID=Q6ILG1_DROME|nr:TPA_inf: HDC09488 [Drosophila melanogaster]